MMNWSGGMGTGGWVFMSLLWVVLIVGIVWATTNLFGRPGIAATSERPEEILARRLASGEIDSATYGQLRAKLRGAHA